MENNFIKGYSRVIYYFIFFLFLFIPNLSFAASQCSKNGYTVLVINGILTKDAGARDNSVALGHKLKTPYNNEPLTVDYVLNPTHGAVVDTMDAILQKYFDQNSFDIKDSDFAQILTDASNKVATQKLLLVGHSQGNFYTNTFYDTVADQSGGIPSQSIGVYSVATPATHVAGGGLYLTSDTDKIIAGAVADAPFTNILKPNTHIDFKQSDDGGLGHDFTKIYLNYEGDKIVSDIESSLNKLKSNDIQDENTPCISPPKLTVAQKIQGTILSVLDPVIIPTQNAVVAVANVIGNAGTAVGQGIHSASSNVANVLGSLIGSDNTPIISTNLTPQNSDTEPTKNTTAPTSPLAFFTHTEINSTSNQNNNQDGDALLAIEPIISSFSQNLPLNTFFGKGGTSLLSPATAEEDSGSTDDAPPAPIVPPTPDTTSPVITILGNNPETVTTGSVYTDAGATALDDIDGARDVVATGIPDTTTPGTYTITYTATDLSGNVSTATRTVNVVTPTIDNPPPPVVTPPAPPSTTTIDTNTTLSPGEYNYENLLVTNNATLILQGDQNSSSSFKGVKINALNITIDPGASISADGQGYGPDSGPGVASQYSIGSSYGGLSYSGDTFSSTYGSATKPTDLGSGGASYGGGAIFLSVSDTFTDNGTISANGNASSSGGSIYVTAKNITGNGMFQANGGSLYGNGYFKSPGGGGRIALHYQNSSISGTIVAKGGCGSYDGWSKSCGQDGTVGLFDESTNNLFLTGAPWKFIQTDAPFSFNNIYILNGATVTAEDGVNVTAKNNLIIDKNSSFTLAGNQVLSSPTLMLNGGSTLTLSGSETITADSLIVDGNSSVTVIPGKILSLTIPDITINAGSSVSADAKGYAQNQGPGTSTDMYTGASYGGMGYPNSTAGTTYGSETDPVDFGSGGASYGGGVVELNVSDTLKNDGIISANGNASSSGGSINIDTNNITGAGSISADGGALYGNGYFKGPGGGGRVALSYQNSSFGGAVEAKGGCGSYDGWSKICAQDGTVHTVDKSVVVAPPAPVLSSQKTITAFNFTNLTPNVTGVIDENNHSVSLAVPFGTDVTNLVPAISISDKASVSPNNNMAQNFANPVNYIVTAEDNSTQNYIVTVTVAPNPNPPPASTPGSSLPSITSYTFNGVADSITINPLVNTLTLALSASENVNWMSVKIENQDDSGIYKLFQSGAGCVDGTSTCTKTWDGILSKGGLLQNGIFRLKVHVKDTNGNEFNDYLSPYVVTVSIPN